MPKVLKSGVAIIRIVSLEEVAGQLPLTGKLLVITYLPGVLPAKSISPVFTFIKVRPVVELNTPAEFDPVNAGIAVPDAQYPAFKLKSVLSPLFTTVICKLIYYFNITVSP